MIILYSCVAVNFSTAFRVIMHFPVTVELLVNLMLTKVVDNVCHDSVGLRANSFNGCLHVLIV